MRARIPRHPSPGFRRPTLYWAGKLLERLESPAADESLEQDRLNARHYVRLIAPDVVDALTHCAASPDEWIHNAMSFWVVRVMLILRTGSELCEMCSALDEGVGLDRAVGAGHDLRAVVDGRISFAGVAIRANGISNHAEDPLK